MNASVTSKLAVCVLYGWSEGKWHGKKLTRELSKAGYRTIGSPDQADLVITHSGGGFLLPNSASNKLVFMVGIPNWPDRHPVLRLPRKMVDDFRSYSNKSRFFLKTLFNIIYIITRARHNTNVWLGWRRKNFMAANTNRKIVVLRNQSDAFMHGGLSLDQAISFSWIGITLRNTSHDDIWENPGPYVSILGKMIEELKIHG